MRSERIWGIWVLTSEFTQAIDYCEAVIDGTHDSPKQVEDGRKLVTSKNIIGGKLDLENCKYYPNLTKVINELQQKNIHTKIGNFLNKDLSNSFVRLEIIGDKKGFWLKPHKDIPEKLMTMMIWANPYQESENLGTDLYDKDFKLVKTIKYVHNNGYFFSSGEDTWHGLELKEIKKERRCIQINYVSFKTDWPVEN